MNKKIAILTQPLGTNYGGIIQNYALQEVLKDLNFNPITINRISNSKKSWFKMCIYYFKIEQIFYRYNFTFIKKYITITKRIDSDKKFYEHFKKHKYDIYLVGSDQTWRPKYSPNIYNYFLDFLDGRKSIIKISYASSFGSSEWEYSEEQRKYVKKLIKQFDAVSVREQTGVELCDKYLGAKAKLVLDPTLLLDVENYRRLYKKEKIKNRTGIFVYILDKDKDKENFVNSISKIINMKVFRNQSKLSYSNKIKNFKDKISPSILAWLKSFDDAEFIITDSFHGTVLAIIYNKPFVTIVNNERGASRFTSILNLLGLQDRLIYDLNSFSPDLLDTVIDFEEINKKLKDLRLKSKNFLIESLGN